MFPQQEMYIFKNTYLETLIKNWLISKLGKKYKSTIQSFNKH